MPCFGYFCFTNPMIDQLTIDRILDTANIQDVVSEFVTLRRRGVNWVGLCPFHNERTPSFYVSPSKGICKCFSCGKGGNSIHFLMEHEQMTFMQAAEWLANKYGIPFPKREMTNAEKELQNERESLFIVNQFARDYFVNTMMNTPQGLAVGKAYFSQKRRFRDDIITKFQLGYCPDKGDSLAKEAIAKGFTKEALVKSGLCYETEDGKLRDRFWGRAIFPVHSLSGKIVAFGGRIMQSNPKAAKYVNSPESIIYSKSKELYGLYQAKSEINRKDRCFLVEGYADVISMVQAGVANVVASSGTSLTTGQIRLIHRFTNNITVLYDGDAAGIKASIRGIDMLLAEGMNVKVLLLPDGEDPDSFSQSQGSAAFQEYIEKNQVDFIKFKIGLFMKESENDPIMRSKLIKDIARSISVIPDAIVRSLYITECSQSMKINEGLLIREINSSISTQEPDSKPARENPGEPDNAGPAPSETQKISEEEKIRIEYRALKDQGCGLMMEKERLLAQLIVRHGEKKFCMIDTEDGEAMLTVGDFISQTLETNEMEIFHPIYKRILQLYRENCTQPSFCCTRFYMSHPDTIISRMAANLLEQQYQLSEIFKDARIDDEEKRLYELTRHIMDDYQIEQVNYGIKQIEKQMQDPAILSSTEACRELQEKYSMYLEARKELSRRLGDRVISL